MMRRHLGVLALACFAIYEFALMNGEAPTIFRASRETLPITFLILPGSSLMCVASAIDPLRAANRIAGGKAFDWRIASCDGQAPATSAGMPVAVSGALDDRADEGRALIAVGGFGTRDFALPQMVKTFRRLARRASAVGGVEAGAWLLARTGLLDGRAATTHWEDLEDFAAAFPEIEVRPDRYVIDGPVFTTGGASPTFDLMLHLVRARLGMAVALDVASVFIYDQARAAADAQPLVSLGRLDGHDPRVARAIRLMESHVDRPLTVAAMAKRVGVTARTLEKAFGLAIGETPGAYYLRLRLQAARRLVLDTRAPMADIAARTGFSSAAAFSRAFSRGFGATPSALRRG